MDSNFIDRNLVAQHFNDHFSSIGSKLADKLPPSSKDTINKFNTLVVSSRSLFSDPIVESDIVEIILSMDNCKAPLQLLLAPYLCDVFNKALCCGVYPDELKIARVTAVFKSGVTS